VSKVPLGFIAEPLSVPLDAILPSRKLPATVATSVKYRQICASIKDIGLIEPLSVTAADKVSKQHLLLDGHVRLIALTELGYEAAPCLVATDDEAYTYNSRVNRLSTIEEHRMIRRAIDRGVSPDHLATALSVDVSHIIKKASLLDGICPEAAEMLKDRQFSTDVARMLRKMKPTRQIECVELLVSANNITVPYAEALLVATPADLLVDGKKTQKLTRVTPEQISRMEREMANLQGQYKLVEQTYADDVLNLVLAKGYLNKLLGNKAVVRYLGQKAPELLSEFELIAQTLSLEH